MHDIDIEARVASLRSGDEAEQQRFWLYLRSVRQVLNAGRYRALTLMAVAVIALLEAIEMLTTRIAMSHAGLVESNPVANAMLVGGRVEIFTALVLVALICRVCLTSKRVGLGVLLAAWVGVGACAMAVGTNLVALWRIGA